MSLKDSQREDIKSDDTSRFRPGEDQKLGEYNDAPLPLSSSSTRRRKLSTGKPRKPMFRVDHLSAQDVQAILMENYSLRQELDMMSHHFQLENMSLQRQLRQMIARNQYLEDTQWMHKKRYRQEMIGDDKPSFPERRKSLGDIERPFYPEQARYSSNNHYFDVEDEYEDEHNFEQDEERFFKPIMHPPPPPPTFGPPPPGYPRPPPPWAMNDGPYDRPLHRRRSKGRYPNEEDHQESDESLLHLMNQVSLGPPPILPPQSPHLPPMGRRRRPSFV